MVAGTASTGLSGLRPTAQPARLRLTLLFAGVFLLLGTAVVVVTFLLTSTGMTMRASRSMSAVPTHGGKAAISVVHPLAVGGPSFDVGRLLAVSWVVLAITAVASTVLGWFVAGWVLRPLRAMTVTARTISAGNLDQRLALAGPNDEFKQLGDTFDDLLARLQGSFEAQRRFVANASHELRTPLTLHRTLLQVALADPDASSASLRATCEELLASGREQERLLEALLTLASSERGLDEREQLDLAALARRSADALLADAQARSVEVVTALTRAPVIGDQSLLEGLTANLIDNAVRYNMPGGRIDVTTTNDTRGAHLWVANTGPAIDPAQVERLFDPFQRLGGRTATDDGHHGLGLSIVQAIAVAHGATVTARARARGGLEVSVDFPRAAVV